MLGPRVVAQGLFSVPRALAYRAPCTMLSANIKEAPVNNLEQYQSPIQTPGWQVPAPKLISRRLYNLVLTGLVVLSFVVMGVCAQYTSTYAFLVFLMNNTMLFTVGTLVASIGGIILMSIARAKENLALGLVGYVLFSVSFGFTTSFILSAYSMETISTAFMATAGIMIVFGGAGIMFPQVFAKIQGVCAVGLLAIIVIELVLALMGVSQTFTDYAVVLIFCGFIGYDVYRATVAVPTLSNALWYAIELYLDIINVFVRLLAIFGRRE